MPFTRPDLDDYLLDAGVQDWDTLINDLIGVLKGPTIPAVYTDLAALITARPPADFGGCVAVTESPPMPWVSDGFAWRPLAPGLRVATTLLSGLTGASVTWTGAFPAKVRRVGVSGRVTTDLVLGGGGVSWKVGDHGAGDDDRYAAGLALTAGTTFEDAATADPGGWSATAQDVVIAPDAGTFTSGAVRLFAFYLTTFAPAA